MKAVRTRVIGIGQPAAGDDGAGIAVVRALRTQTLPTGVALHEITDPARLIALLDGIQRAILVDAVVSEDCPGSIKCLTLEDLSVEPVTPLSSHGMRIADAIGLAHTLVPAAARCDIHIIGITIEPPNHYTHAMSAPVVAALPRATSLICQLLRSEKTLTCV